MLYYSRAYQQNKEESKIEIENIRNKSNNKNDYFKRNEYNDKNKDMDNSKYEFIYIPGYLPIPINYLYEQYKNELLFNKDNKNQESNSNSQLSTTSDGEQNIINNINNNLINKIKKEKKLNLEESIKKGIKDISVQFNSNPFQQCPLTLACFYHCDLALSEQEESSLNMEINDTIKDLKIKRDKNGDNKIKKICNI